MKRLFKTISIVLCLFMLMGAVVSCVTFQAPSITAEERVLVEKILARRVQPQMI
jgi:hypothetical protein